MTTRDEDQTGTTARTVRWPTALSERLQLVADEEDRSFSDIVRRACDRYLDAREFDGARLDSPGQPDLVELVEPRDSVNAGYFDLVVEGFRVPHVRVFRSEYMPDGRVNSTDAATYVLSLDDRFQTTAMPWGELWKWAWFLANAMAVAAGYSSHGPNARRLNRYGPPELIDLQAWAERGWVAADARGSSGRTYEITSTFSLPAFEDADRRCYGLRDALVGLLGEAGARDVVTRLVALGAMELEPEAQRETV